MRTTLALAVCLAGSLVISGSGCSKKGHPSADSGTPPSDASPADARSGGDTTPGADLIPEPSPSDARSDAEPDLPLDAAGGTTDGVAPTTRLIDDFESGTPTGVSPEADIAYSWRAWANLVGRFGEVVLPEAGIAEPAAPRPGSRRAFHLTGGPYEDGADLFTELHPATAPLETHVDLRAYAGITFWTRGNPGQGGALIVAIKGGSGVDREFWEDELIHNMPWPSLRVPVTSDWHHHTILFTDFKIGQLIPHGPANFDPRIVNSLHFIAGTGGITDFGVWIDDVALLCRGPCPPL